MQKTNKKSKKYTRSHHVRVSAVAIAIATCLHVSGISHIEKRGIERVALPTTSMAQIFENNVERENETARHAVRFDEGLRSPTVGGL
jgi:hypothetical protein